MIIVIIKKDLLIDKLYSDLKSEFNIIRNIEVYFQIDFPILFSFNSNGSRYLIYVLDYKRIKRKLEFIVTEVNDNEIFEFLNEKKSLLNILTLNSNGNEKNIKYYKKQYKNKNYETSSCSENCGKFYEDKLPSNDFKLTKVIPNEIDVREVKEYVIERMDKTIFFTSNVHRTQNKSLIKNDKSFASSYSYKYLSDYFSFSDLFSLENSLNNFQLENYKNENLENKIKLEKSKRFILSSVCEKSLYYRKKG